MSDHTYTPSSKFGKWFLRDRFQSLYMRFGKNFLGRKSTVETGFVQALDNKDGYDAYR